MITVSEAKNKVLAHYERHYQDWAKAVFLEATCHASDVLDDEVFSLPLHPPTEKQVLQDSAAARNWVKAWRSAECTVSLQWESRQWASVGRQEVPERLILKGYEEIAAFAGRSADWQCAFDRTQRLASLWNAAWRAACPRCNVEEFSQAIHKTVKSYKSLTDRDWVIFGQVLVWLVDHPLEQCYVRQLPIRGIDTKWLESHYRLVSPLFCALTGEKELPFLGIPFHIRVRFLDPSLSLGGLLTISVIPQEFNTYPRIPQTVIVCENLVSVLALPKVPGALAIHGGGYAVSALAGVEWLAETPLYYWGDLDSNGFAILNQLRSHFSHAVSLMMDLETLEAHRELCGNEDHPNLGTLSRLTGQENEVLQLLLSYDPPLRLEQERIGWGYVLNTINHLK